ncbi:MAG: glycogen debranching N-terminal domain-containing protein [Actinomycetota bacterium]
MQERVIKGPRGEKFEVIASEDIVRILNEGAPFITAGVEVEKLVLKEDDGFLYTNVEGNMPRGNPFGLGFYHNDTRFLSTYEIYIEGKKPLLLSSSAGLDYRSFVEQTNPDIHTEDGSRIPQDTLNIRRLRTIKGNLYERIRVKNYNSFPVEVTLQFVIGADFFDIFEVRGLRRMRRGQILKPKFDGRFLSLAYLGLDDKFRQMKIGFGPKPTQIQTGPEGATVSYRLSLKERETKVINMSFRPFVGTERRQMMSFEAVTSLLHRSYQAWETENTRISTDNELFNAVLERGERDLRQLLTEMPQGTTMAAGIPWFVAPFGRDSLIACLQTLILNKRPAYETLKMFAQLQGTVVDGWRDEEPGKIMHEIRRGELASLNEIPHTPYYGTVDATPLYLILAAELFRWTGDGELLSSLNENLDLALNWIDEYGDADGDLFVEYKRKSPRGLIHQGWKDSGGSVCHKDASPADPPIALAEVQAYVYLAKIRLADVYEHLGYEDKAADLRQTAAALKERFNEVFWIDRDNCVALALDKNKHRVEVVASNAGHCLFGEVVEKKQAKKLVHRLMQPDMFSGWGIRTLSKTAPTYNPMQYHSGTVWPHDNSLVAFGFKKYGFTREANKIATSLFDAALSFPDYRLPELFCGFTRRVPHPPVGYPVSCAPQAWAAGSVFLLLQGMLGIMPDAPKGVVDIIEPTLPKWLNEVKVSDLRVGGGVLDLVFTRKGDKTGCAVKRNTTGLEVKTV